MRKLAGNKQTVVLRSARKSAFTLIEISIVLVIIGLVIGGVLVGNSLIHSAELREVVTDTGSLHTAANVFKEKYDGIPGDMNDASDFWSGSTSGDGNSRIDYLFGGPGEEYEAWNHLSLAGLTQGSYDGTQTDLPKASVPGGLYRISYQTYVYGHSGHMISLNAFNPVSNLAHSAILTPQDAFSIDDKMDDGRPDTGLVLTFNPSGVPGCITNYHTSSSGDYILSNDGVLCKMFFRVEF